jgi:single-stranded DNA-binding protein
MQSQSIMSGVIENAPQVRYTESNLAVASFNLIFNKEEMKSIKCAIFGKRAEGFRDNAGAGTKIVVHGELGRQGQEGNKKPVIRVEGYEVISRCDVPASEGETCPEEQAAHDDLIGEEEIPF